MTGTNTATAVAHPNIAFIKYWGDRDSSMHLPANSSFSMNLDGLYTRTRVLFDETLPQDRLVFNRQEAQGAPLQRVANMLADIRSLAGIECFAEVESENNFPAGAGIASSASAFAALALAASQAAGLSLDEPALSRLARRGSGSACRSVPGGFVVWQAGQQEQDSYAYTIAPPQHWDLVDCVAVVSESHKPVTSLEGHSLAESSPLQASRVASAPQRLDACQQAVLGRDFMGMADIIELDSNMMHSVMMTSTPSLVYWLPPTIAIMRAVTAMRTQEAIPACYTIDAGPNVHVITLAAFAGQVAERLAEMDGVQQVLSARPGGPARLISE